MKLTDSYTKNVCILSFSQAVTLFAQEGVDRFSHPVYCRFSFYTNLEISPGRSYGRIKCTSSFCFTRLPPDLRQIGATCLSERFGVGNNFVEISLGPDQMLLVSCSQRREKKIVKSLPQGWH